MSQVGKHEAQVDPATTGVEPLVELVDVQLDHPRAAAPIVRGGNLRVARGEVVVIVAPAGVGSSRLVAAALGECALAAGHIAVLGHDVGRLRRASLRLLRRRVGIVPQELCLLGDRSAQMNVVLPLEIDGIPRSTSIVRAAVALSRLGVAPEGSTAIDTLPMSIRQRVAVARALVRDPELVLADQPTSMQDAEGAELVCEAFAEAAAAGAACVVFGRDPALRAIAERRGWRQLALVEGQLRPLGDIMLAGHTIEELLVDFDSAPAAAAGAALGSLPIATASRPNLVPFPSADRRPASGPVARDLEVHDENENVA